VKHTYRCVSADSHWQPPPDTWAHRLPAELRDRVPKRVKLPNGGDGLLQADGSISHGGTGHFCGHTPEDFDPTIVHFEDEVGHGGPEQRIKEQTVDGIDGEVLFGFLGGRAGRDPGYASAMVRAYNDYLAQEFCAYAPDRLFGMGALTGRGVDQDVDEMEHCAELGLKGVVLSSYPSGERYPTPEDDRFWAAAVDLDVPLAVHTSMSLRQGVRGEFMIKYPIEPEGYERPPIDIVDRMSRYGTRHCGCLELTQLIMTGVFDRFPKLRLYWAENQLGWIPIFKEQMDMVYEANRFWVERILGLKRLSRRPSEYVEEHAFWGFFDDPIGVRFRHEVGVDRIMWGSDFPHEVSRWPNSQQLLAEQLADLSEQEKRKIMAENAVQFFHLDR
jgi:predicted TIM-barrel fold metal-dependent hydrolase